VDIDRFWTGDGNLGDRGIVCGGTNVRLRDLDIHRSRVCGGENHRSAGQLNQSARNKGVHSNTALAGKVKLRCAGADAEEAIGRGAQGIAIVHGRAGRNIGAREICTHSFGYNTNNGYTRSARGKFSRGQSADKHKRDGTAKHQMK